MEPYRKRQRLYASAFGSHRTPQAYYDSLEPDELADYDREVVTPYRGQRIQRNEAPEPSPLQLQRRKHEIDNKFKSALETIMDKYARDFTGIDDEIDFGTDEVYMTGHLARAQYEGDVGDWHDRHETSSEEEAILDALESGSEDATEENEEEDANTEDERSDDDIEDDFLLRGLTTAARRLQPNVDLYAQDSLPASRSQGPAQHEPPYRSQLMSQRSIHEHENIEPAWRFPEIPALYRNDSHVEPVWRIDKQSNAYSRQYSKPYTSARAAPVPPLRLRSPSPNPRVSLWDPLQVKKRTRIDFTSEDDECLLDCIRKATVRGMKIDNAFFRGMAAHYPRHPVQSWRKRYEKKYAYQAPGNSEAEQASDSDIFSGHTQLPLSREPRPDLLERTFPKSTPFIRARQLQPNIHARPHSASLAATHERPARVRKPPPRDSGLVSWEKALSKVKSSDPFLHAEFLQDARERPNHEGSWYLNQPLHSHSHQEQPQVFKGIRTSIRTGFTNEDELQIFRQPRRSSSGDDAHFDHDGTEVCSESSHLHTTKDAKSIEIRKPCPHVGCKNNPSILYRLQRSIEEEQSEMATHLMHAHHTTPYPCAEEHCDHKGENGFLVDSDLVNHVRSAHPTGGAMHRLRGRVDQDLFANEKHGSLGSSPSHFNYGNSYNMSVIEASSEVRGFRGPSSSQHISSGSDLDLTSTSRGVIGASTCTPLTSVSSLLVNHPSATKTLDRTSLEANYGNSSVVEQQASRNRVESPVLSLPSPGIRNSISSTAGILGNDGSCIISVEEGDHISPRIFLPHMRQSMASSIPDSQLSVEYVAPRASKKTQKPQLPPRDLSPSTPKKGNTSIIATSHSSKPKVTFPPPRTSRDQTNSNIAEPSIATSYGNRGPRNFVAPGALNYEEDDELTLSLDGFLLLSSRARTVMPSLEFSDGLKREETSDITILSSVEKAPSKKRKLELFQGSDEIDELADEPSTCVSMLGPSARKISKVKTEDSQNTTAIIPVNPMKRKYKKLRERQANPVAAQARPSTSHHKALVHRMSTPLLDLTPTRRPAEKGVFEIADSAAEGSSQVEPSGLNAGRRSLSVELLTPSKPIHNPVVKQEGPTIVVKTPKGTLRRCGENGFACRKSFCFRCGIEC